MNFLGVGPLELMLVLIVGVIVLGPERIPEVAVQIARALRFLRGYATDATAEMRAELTELMEEYEEVRKELQEFREGVTKDVSSIAEEVHRTISDSQAIIEPGGDPRESKGPEDAPSA